MSHRPRGNPRTHVDPQLADTRNKGSSSCPSIEGIPSMPSLSLAHGSYNCSPDTMKYKTINSEKEDNIKALNNKSKA